MSVLSARAVIMQALLLGDGHGLELVARIRERTKGCISVSQGSTYVTLRKLERKKLVRSYSDDVVRPGRPAVLYALTPAGRKQAIETRTIVLALFGIKEKRRP